MNVSFSSKLLDDNWLLKIVEAYAQLCELSVRKKIFPISAKLKDLCKEYVRETDRLFFVYSKLAPASFPNAGARVIEAALMEENEYKQYLADADARDEKTYSLKWLDKRPKVEIPKSILKKMSQDELGTAELFFDIQEGSDEPKK